MKYRAECTGPWRCELRAMKSVSQGHGAPECEGVRESRECDVMDSIAFRVPGGVPDHGADADREEVRLEQGSVHLAYNAADVFLFNRKSGDGAVPRQRKGKCVAYELAAAELSGRRLVARGGRSSRRSASASAGRSSRIRISSIAIHSVTSSSHLRSPSSRGRPARAA